MATSLRNYRRPAALIVLVMATASVLARAQPPGGGGGTAGARCDFSGSDYFYEETISTDGTTRTIKTNNCPNHPYKNINPNYPVKLEQTYTVPAKPMYDTAAAADLSEQGGVTGLLFSGAQLFSPYGGRNYGQVTGYSNSATAAEGDTFDLCSCHSAQTTAPSYHCHIPPSCLLGQLGQTDGAHSPQVGWALDGFPVYGPRGPGGVMMKTCKVTGGTYGTDVCTDDGGGYKKALPGTDEFEYRYYMLGTYNDGKQCANPVAALPAAEYYPNTPTKYNGCCPSGVTCQSFIKACTGAATNGYTASYSAAAKATLTKNTAACWASGEQDNAATGTATGALSAVAAAVASVAALAAAARAL